MTWSIQVYKSPYEGFFSVLLPDSLYDSMVQIQEFHGMRYHAGKKGIGQDNLEKYLLHTKDLIKSLNAGEPCKQITDDLEFVVSELGSSQDGEEIPDEVYESDEPTIT